MTVTSSKRFSWLHHRGVQLAFGISVSLACLWFALSDLLSDRDSLSQLRGAFAKADYRTLLPMWISLALFYWLKAWRWRLLLKPVGDFQPVRDLIPPTMIGFAFNNLLPAHLGDFVRVFVFARQHGLTKTAVLSSVVLERVFDIVAILLFLGLGLVFVPDMPESVRKSAYVFGAGAGAMVLGGLVYVVWTKPFVRMFEAVLKRVPGVPEGLRGKVAGMLETGAEGLASLKSPTLIAGILFTSILQWALNGLQVHLALWSFGVHVSPLVSCIVLGVVAFGVTVPSSPGYFGVIQLCFMTVLALFTKDQASVFGASVYYHMSQYIPVTLIGLYYFNATGLKVREVEETAEHDREAVPLAATEANIIEPHTSLRKEAVLAPNPATSDRPTIAITMGDPAGVGPEICLLALANAELNQTCRLVVFGDIRILERCAGKLQRPCPVKHWSVDEWQSEGRLSAESGVIHLPTLDEASFVPATCDANTGRASFAYIEAAIEAALRGEIAGVATGPISKEALHLAGIDFPGHTEIFAERTNAAKWCMMQFAPELVCTFATVHIGYTDVPRQLTSERILDVIRLTDVAMRRLKSSSPVIVVCGLNPHAGENGLFGNREEEQLVVPAIEAARVEGLNIIGPLPADTAFIPQRRQTTDAFVCLYHDQGHIPIKALAFDSAVNTTLGLPIVRTSVDHGTACDIAWQGIARPDSLFAAIRLAARLSRRQDDDGAMP